MSRFELPDNVEIGHSRLETFGVDTRLSEPIVARVRRRGDGEFVAKPVTKMGPLGIEISDSDICVLSKGEAVDLELHIGGQRTIYEGLVVDVVASDPGERVVAVRLARKVAQEAPGVERRSSERWLCSEQFFPTCIAINPSRFDDYLYFQVRDVSGTGLQLVSSLRNRFLIPGTKLDLVMSLPTPSQIGLSVEVVRVGITSQGGRDVLTVGVRFTTITSVALEGIGQYLLQFANAGSHSELETAGLVRRSKVRGVEFSYSKTEEEYRAVLDLRLRAGISSGRLGPDVRAADMADVYDARTRILLGKFRGEVVASARMLFCDRDEVLEQDTHVSQRGDLPRRDRVVEVTKISTAPAFRKEDLLVAMFKSLASACWNARRDYVLATVPRDLIEFCERVGYCETGLSYENDRDGRVVMIGNSLDAMGGKRVSPILWNVVWGGVARWSIAQEMPIPQSTTRVRYHMYRAVGPLARLLFDLRRSPRPSVDSGSGHPGLQGSSLNRVGTAPTKT